MESGLKIIRFFVRSAFNIEVYSSMKLSIFLGFLGIIFKIIFGTNKTYPLYINGEIKEKVAATKYLVVWLNGQLDWKKNVETKLNKILL